MWIHLVDFFLSATSVVGCARCPLGLEKLGSQRVCFLSCYTGTAVLINTDPVWMSREETRRGTV